MIKEKWNKLMETLGITKVETTADGVFMKEEDIDKLAKVNDDNELLKQNVTSLTKRVEDLEADKKALEADKTTLQNEVVELKKKPSEPPTKVEKDADAVTSSKKGTTGTRLVSAIEEQRDAMLQANEAFDITKTTLED